MMIINGKNQANFNILGTQFDAD